MTTTDTSTASEIASNLTPAQRMLFAKGFNGAEAGELFTRHLWAGWTTTFKALQRRGVVDWHLYGWRITALGVEVSATLSESN